MATDVVAQLADSLARTGVEEGELSYKGQGRKLDNAQSGEYHIMEDAYIIIGTIVIESQAPLITGKWAKNQ